MSANTAAVPAIASAAAPKLARALTPSAPLPPLAFVGDAEPDEDVDVTVVVPALVSVDTTPPAFVVLAPELVVET